MRRSLLIFISALLFATLHAGTSTDGVKADYAQIKSLMARQQYEKAAALLPSFIAERPSSMKAAPMSDLGTCYFKMGRFSEANHTYEEALRQRATNSTLDAIRLNYSNNLVESGAYERAMEVLEEVTDPNALPHKLVNMAHAAFYLDTDAKRSLALLDSCLAQELLSSELRFGAIQNKAFILSESGDSRESLACFKEALTCVSDTMTYYQTLANVALAEARCGEYAQAEQDIDRALKWFELVSSQEYAIALRKKGEIMILRGDKRQAAELFKKYFERETRMLTERLTDMSHTERLSYWLKEKATLAKCFLLEDFDPEFMYEVASFRRRTSLLGMRDTATLTSLMNLKARDVRKSLKKGEVAVEFISYPDLNGAMTYAAIVLPKSGQVRFVKLFDESFIYEPGRVGRGSIMDAIYREVASDKNKLYSDTSLGDKVWQPIVKVLPAGTSQIYFAPEGLFHFWGIENVPFAGKEKYSMRRVTSTALLANPRRGITQKRESLLVGGLNYSALPEETESSDYAHDAADYLRHHTGKTNHFAYLPGTRTEVDSIRAIMPRADISYDAPESTLKELLPRYSIVHVATHGYSLSLGIRRRPEFLADSLSYDMSLLGSGIALSGANIAADYPGHEDGILSARELCDIDLSNVDFVVLSACQTAQGNVTDEGATGLVRGLKNAGVQTIMATLWEVDDKSTMLFMHKFYSLLEQGKSKHEAYRGAQEYLQTQEWRVPRRKFSARTLSAQNSADFKIIKYDAPYYWAPFIIIDD